MSKGCADAITNPIPAAQIVHVDFDWQCLLPPETTGIQINGYNKTSCITSDLLMEGLVGAICTALDFSDLEMRCLNVDDNTDHKQVLQAIIDKACNYVDPDCPECEDEEDDCCTATDPSGNTIPNTFELLSELQYCNQDTWTTDLDPSEDCITPQNLCGPEVTTEEYMQAIISRVISIEKERRKKCDRIDVRESKLEELQLEIDSNDCCNNNLQSQINTLTAAVETLQNG